MTTDHVRLNDINVAYRAAGDHTATPVVLVHGLAEDSLSWQPQLDTMDGYRLHAYDLRGHGHTDIGSPEGTLAQLDGDLCRFLEAVTGPAICIGFSLGGTVVLSAAANRPDLVQSAVVLGTSTVVGRSAAGFYDDRIALAQSGDRAGLAEALQSDTLAGLFRTTDIDALAARRLDAIGDGRGYINAARAMAGLHTDPLTPRLPAISCPVTIIGAEHDNFCPRRAADIMLAQLPAARYLEVPAAGHLMNVDNPTAVTAALTTALRGNA